MIKAVMFDAGGVLHPSGRHQQEDIQQELGLTDEQIKQFYERYLPLLLTGEASEEDIWMRAKNELGIRPVDTDEKLLTRSFEATLQKTEEMYKIVELLKSEGIMVLLLTNVSEVFAEILERHGHYAPFDMRVLSYEVGLAKPDPKIFQLALQKLGVSPHEAVFVDDSAANVFAAKELGIHGIVFSDPEKLKRELDAIIPSINLSKS
jgi:epoxide hydrolase-like predicted phosphatase